MEQQPETAETTTEQPAEAPVKTPVLSRNQVLFLFLASMLIGFAGVLAGIVPLVALAMIGPVVVALLA